MQDDLSDVADGKTGVELFRELVRIYSVAHVEDYYKNGVWRNDLMRIDYRLVEGARADPHCSPPEMPPLEEVPEPELPQPAMFPGLAQPFIPGDPNAWRLAAAAAAARAKLTLPGGVPQFLQTKLSLPMGSMRAGGVGAALELRNIALFIAKHKLDPSTVKGLLIDLTPEHRRLVMEGFKTTFEDADEVIEALKEYIEECKSELPESTEDASTNGVSALTNGRKAKSELKAMAVYIAKKKLDPPRAKAALMALDPEERKVVMENFESSSPGLEATNDFEVYASAMSSASTESAEKKRRVDEPEDTEE
mmetsp:Transcript_64591/g.179670  ORF Transcript_64591/g.179670 Transcript_64591/m.179670 type:complete len:307 (-) Transcript_64591:151-1071(-)